MAATRLVTLSELHWPSGNYRDAAALSLTPEQLEARLGIRFEHGLDDLDYYRTIGLALPSGRQIALHWYERAPEPRAIAIRTDANDDLAAALTESLTALDLPNSVVVWRSDAL